MFPLLPTYCSLSAYQQEELGKVEATCNKASIVCNGVQSGVNTRPQPACSEEAIKVSEAAGRMAAESAALPRHDHS